jgi:hypothetical protein
MRLPKLNKLVEVMQIRGVKIFVNWSMLLIGAIILLGAVEDAPLAFTVLGAYYGVILLHECGHLVAAQRKGCAVGSIELYPIWGITRFSEPYSRHDHCIILWRGVVAQALIAVPLVVWVEVFGYTRFQAINAILVIFGFFSLSMLSSICFRSGRSTVRLPEVFFRRSSNVQPRGQQNANRRGEPGAREATLGVRFRRVRIRMREWDRAVKLLSFC